MPAVVHLADLPQIGPPWGSGRVKTKRVASNQSALDEIDDRYAVFLFGRYGSI